jgi:hypothetical protein
MCSNLPVNIQPQTAAVTPEPALPKPEPGTPCKSRWRLVLAVLLFLYFAYFLVSSGRVRTMDEVSAAFQVESLAHSGSTAIPQAVRAQLFYGSMDRFSRPQSPYPPGQAVAMLPWYFAGQFAARHLPGIPRGARDVVSDFFLTGQSAFCSALAAALGFLIFLRLGITFKTSLAATAILALAMPLAAYSGWVFSEPLATAMLLAAAATLFAGRGNLPISLARAAVTGVLLGAAIWVRPTHVIAVPVFAIALLVHERYKLTPAFYAMSAVVTVAVALYLWRNAYLFGSPSNFGYPVVAEGGKALNTFRTPLLTGLTGFLASPGKSVFLFAPPVLLAIMGLPRLWQRNRGLAVVAGLSPLVYLLFFATYTQWEGGYCFGPRYLVPALGLLGLGVGPALESSAPLARRVGWLVFAGGFLVQAIGVTTSFLEAAVIGAYYDAQYNYRMSFSSISIQIHLLLHYLASPPAPIGLGFDKWWVFLSRAGVGSGAIAVLAAVLCMGALASAAWMYLARPRV